MPKNIPPPIPHRPPATFFLDMYVTSNRQEIGKTKFCSHKKSAGLWPAPILSSVHHYAWGAILPPPLMHNRVK